MMKDMWRWLKAPVGTVTLEPAAGLMLMLIGIAIYLGVPLLFIILTRP